MQHFDIHDTTLGKSIPIPDKYDASLLFRIPRSENRTNYGIKASKLPFVGYDVWNCYELSFLTNNGMPVSRILKLIYSSNSEYLVESKSLKIYLNAFNMDAFGSTVVEAEKSVVEVIKRDLNQLLETEVVVVLLNNESIVQQAFSKFDKCNLQELIPLEYQEAIIFRHFYESPELLKSQVSDKMHSYRFRTDVLRSNCRVTNQPDWGDLFVEMSTKHVVELSSILEYLVSFRKENHFHEEVVEMIYKRFLDIFKPEKLMVGAMYMRRGGIDINPIRASHIELLDEVLISKTIRVEKTLRQ